MMPNSLRQSFPGARKLSLRWQRLKFKNSKTYWEKRYSGGDTSGSGSYGQAAQVKAGFLNAWVKNNQIASITEFGCGDGNQLALAEYPSYKGLDVSRIAIQLCKEKFANDGTKSFYLYDGNCFVDNARIFGSALAISLDVIFHLVEDAAFNMYMSHLFDAAQRYVIIYSTNYTISGSAPHVRHREFVPWIDANRPTWRLIEQSSGPKSEHSQADFFVYQRLTSTEL